MMEKSAGNCACGGSCGCDSSDATQDYIKEAERQTGDDGCACGGTCGCKTSQ